MVKKTLKSMRIKPQIMVKHGGRIRVYEYKGILYTSKSLAVKAYERDRIEAVRSHRSSFGMPGPGINR